LTVGSEKAKIRSRESGARVPSPRPGPLLEWGHVARIGRARHL